MKRLKGRHLKGTLVVILLIVGVIVLYCGPPRFWGDFTGITEATAIKRLGTPMYDSRKVPPRYNGELSDEFPQGGSFTLGWAHGAVRLSLYFEDGMVTSQRRTLK